MQIVTAFVPRDPAACWRLFADVAALAAWVPGLRRAETIAMALGMPGEVHFEFASSLTYTLVYAYDAEAREIRWEPKLGRRDGVTGFVRFEPADGGARMTYGLQTGENRSAADLQLGDPAALVASFVTFASRP
jgi:hypothetical protein